jgi:hypothetical protein
MMADACERSTLQQIQVQDKCSGEQNHRRRDEWARPLGSEPEVLR